MNRKKIEQGFLLGLYLFIRQMQLSLDRSTWIDFIKYSKTTISAQDVVLALKEKFYIDDHRHKYMRRKRPVNNLWRRLFTKKNTLYDDEQIFIYDCVNTLSEYMGFIEAPDVNSINTLRINLAFSEKLIESRISGFCESFRYVEHCNANENLKLKSIEEISKGAGGNASKLSRNPMIML